MNVLKDHCGDAYCVTTRGTSPGENLQELPDNVDAQRAYLKHLIMQMTEDECAELLKCIKMYYGMTEGEATAYVESIRPKREAIT